MIGNLNAVELFVYSVSLIPHSYLWKTIPLQKMCFSENLCLHEVVLSHQPSNPDLVKVALAPQSC